MLVLYISSYLLIWEIKPFIFNQSSTLRFWLNALFWEILAGLIFAASNLTLVAVLQTLERAQLVR